MTRDVEPYAIVAGNPASPLRKRFDETRIALLLEMQWWNWSMSQLQAVMPLMTSTNIEALHRHWQEHIHPS